jgi:hypothetical protein
MIHINASVLLTVGSLSGLRIEGAGCLDTIILLGLSRITAYNFMLFSKSSCNPELMKPGLAPHVLFSDPSTLYKITLAFLYASPIGVVKMGLSPEDLSVDVATGVCNDTSS